MIAECFHLSRSPPRRAYDRRSLPCQLIRPTVELPSWNSVKQSYSTGFLALGCVRSFFYQIRIVSGILRYCAVPIPRAQLSTLITFAMATEGQFDGQQFSKDEVAKKTVEQYNSEQTRTFYKVVMGGGGYDIHYGIYNDPEWTVKEASQATTDFALDMMNWVQPIKKGMKILDLGSGHGGAMHRIVQRFGCFVQGFNICPEQNTMNLKECEALQIRDKVDVFCGNMNDGLPEEWTDRFDAVFSSEVLCHAADKGAILKHIKKILKPGGVVVFTDIMGADGADEEQLRTFTDRNATVVMGRPSWYMEWFKEAGLKYVAWVDLSHHLVTFYKQMLQNVVEKRDALKAAGITDAYLDNWRKSLADRHDVQQEHNVFAWGVFVLRKE